VAWWWWWLVLAPIAWTALAIGLGPILGYLLSRDTGGDDDA
jgi:hypothetical protein